MAAICPGTHVTHRIIHDLAILSHVISKQFLGISFDREVDKMTIKTINHLIKSNAVLPSTHIV